MRRKIASILVVVCVLILVNGCAVKEESTMIHEIDGPGHYQPVLKDEKIVKWKYQYNFSHGDTLLKLYPYLVRFKSDTMAFSKAYNSFKLDSEILNQLEGTIGYYFATSITKSGGFKEFKSLRNVYLDTVIAKNVDSFFSEIQIIDSSSLPIEEELIFRLVLRREEL